MNEIASALSNVANRLAWKGKPKPPMRDSDDPRDQCHMVWDIAMENLTEHYYKVDPQPKRNFFTDEEWNNREMPRPGPTRADYIANFWDYFRNGLGRGNINPTAETVSKAKEVSDDLIRKIGDKQGKDELWAIIQPVIMGLIEDCRWWVKKEAHVAKRKRSEKDQIDMEDAPVWERKLFLLTEEDHNGWNDFKKKYDAQYARLNNADLDAIDEIECFVDGIKDVQEEMKEEPGIDWDYFVEHVDDAVRGADGEDPFDDD